MASQIPPQPVVVPESQVSPLTIVLIGQLTPVYFELAANEGHRVLHRDFGTLEEHVMIWNKTDGDIILNNRCNNIPLSYQLPILPSSSNGNKGSNLGRYGAAIGEFIAFDTTVIVMGYLTLTSDNSPLPPAPASSHDYNAYYCMQGRMVTAVHDVTHWQQLWYYGQEPRYREHCYGQDYSRPLHNEYVPLAPQRHSMTYMIVELLSVVIPPSLRLVERSSDEIAVQRVRYPHITSMDDRIAVKQSILVSSSSHDNVIPKCRSFTDRISNLFSSSSNSSSGSKAKNSSSSSSSRGNRQRAAGSSLNDDYHGPRCDWDKLRITLNHPVEFKNVQIEWIQDPIFYPTIDAFIPDLPPNPDDRDVTPIVPLLTIPIIPSSSSSSTSTSLTSSSIIDCNTWLFPSTIHCYRQSRCRITASHPGTWQQCSVAATSTSTSTVTTPATAKITSVPTIVSASSSSSSSVAATTRDTAISTVMLSLPPAENCGGGDKGGALDHLGHAGPLDVPISATTKCKHHIDANNTNVMHHMTLVMNTAINGHCILSIVTHSYQHDLTPSLLRSTPIIA